ncbi:hypothetical protein [Kineococcus sp. SYSU DK001]|uniref:hypothetical protein n=1 Tax=Kineococcus sp. SYSU DK001 TaxID=3383122 RepID=UPI003D7D9A90
MSTTVVKGNNDILYYTSCDFLDFTPPGFSDKPDVTLEDYLEIQCRTLVEAACNKAILVHSTGEDDDDHYHYFVRGQIWRVSEKEDDEMDEAGTPVRAILENLAVRRQVQDAESVAEAWDIAVSRYLTHPASAAFNWRVQDSLNWANA